MYRIGLGVPRVVEIGRTVALPIPILSDADAVQTATGVPADSTVTLRANGTTLLDAVAITTVGPPASYTLADSVTEDLTPANWLEVWNLAGLGVFYVSGYLALKGYHSHVTDASLQQLHSEILNLLPPGETSCEKFRVAATEKVERDLIARGRRPWLIFDEWALFDAERYAALHYWANDAALRTSSGGGDASEYRRIAEDYLQAYKDEWLDSRFRYDEDQDGVLEDEDDETPEPPGIMLTAGRPRSRGGGRHRGDAAMGRY